MGWGIFWQDLWCDFDNLNKTVLLQEKHFSLECFRLLITFGENKTEFFKCGVLPFVPNNYHQVRILSFKLKMGEKSFYKVFKREKNFRESTCFANLAVNISPQIWSFYHCGERIKSYLIDKERFEQMIKGEIKWESRESNIDMMQRPIVEI